MKNYNNNDRYDDIFLSNIYRVVVIGFNNCCIDVQELKRSLVKYYLMDITNKEDVFRINIFQKGFKYSKNKETKENKLLLIKSLNILGGDNVSKIEL